jgi:hypothetical protein
MAAFVGHSGHSSSASLVIIAVRNILIIEAVRE